MNGELTFADALAAYNAGRRVDAARICQHLLKDGRKDANSAHLLGLMLFDAGDFQAARAPLRAAAEGKPGDGNLWLHAAQAATASGHPAESLACLRRAILLAPATAQALAALAGLAARQGGWAGAALMARRLTVLEPGNPSHRYFHAQCRGSLNDAAQVSLEIRRARLLLPENVEILKYLANFLTWSGDANGAERELRRLIRFMPGDAQAWRSYAMHLRSRRMQRQAIPLLKRMLVLVPDAFDDWRAMREVAQNLHDLKAAAAAARRCAACNPGDADALMSLAQAERALGKTGRLPAIFEALERLAPDNPAAWIMLALDRQERGQEAEAGTLFDSFFRNTHEKLISRSPDIRCDSGLICFLTFNLFGGRFEAVKQYCSVARTLRFTSPRLEIEVFKAAVVADAAVRYFAAPVAWSGNDRLMINVPVWGKKYADLWVKNCLSSMLTAENRHFLDRQESAFHFISTEETWEYLQTLPLFQEIAARHHVCFSDISPVLQAGYESTNYHAMVIAQWMTLCIAVRERAAVFVLGADAVYSRSALSHLAALLDKKSADIFYTIDFPISGVAEPELEAFRTSDGLLSVPEDALSELFIGHPSARLTPHDIAEDDLSLPTDPSRLNVRLDGGIQIRSMQPQLVCATREALDGFWAPTLIATDNGFADIVLCNLSGEERMMMLTDAGKFACAVLEFDEEERAGSGYFAKRRTISDSLSVELARTIQSSGFLTRGRVWAMRNPLTVMRSGAKPEPARTGFLDAIAAALPFSERDEAQELFYRLGRPAFARFADRLK